MDQLLQAEVSSPQICLLLIICTVQDLVSNELSAAADLCTGEVVMHDLNKVDCLCLMINPGDLCNCGFSNPVESLKTTPNSQGDPLIQLPE